MVLFSLTEVRRFRIHGGFGRLDDPRRPGRAPFDRRCITGIPSYPSVFEQEKATVRDYIEKCSQGAEDNSAGMAIRPHSAIHCVSPTRDSGSLFLILFCSCCVCLFSIPKGARLLRFLQSAPALHKPASKPIMVGTMVRDP